MNDQGFYIMSFLNLRKKNTEAKATPQKEMAPKKLILAEGAKTGKSFSAARPHILMRPHVTEKASASAEKGVYVFRVAIDAGKREIAEAVRAFYKVTPVKVTIVNMPTKRKIVKGRLGVRAAGKKAYVYLKKGEKIEVV